ncbi:formylmethanofuran dehydrogenase subunit E family protein [bacterium]|nr:formylmethanofuran dehydrogenase subunit E family protein [bacterium]
MGQILGVRIALKGLGLVGTENPKDLIVIVENDRCIADAIQIVTGTRIGRRTMKLVDYGKMAATFINVNKNKAFRVNVRKVNPESSGSKEAREAALYADDEDLLAWREVKVNLKPEEMPGKPKRTVKCVLCNEKIFDSKDIQSPDGPICLACAKGAYYEIV